MIVDRILKIIELKGINKSKFYKETGLSNGFLDKVKDVGASKLELILKAYPDINPHWLVTGSGNILKQNESNYGIVEEPQEPYNADNMTMLMNMLKDKDDKILELSMEIGRLNEVITRLKQHVQNPSHVTGESKLTDNDKKTGE